MFSVKRAVPIFNMRNPQFFFYQCGIIQMIQLSTLEPAIKSILLNTYLKAIPGILFFTKKMTIDWYKAQEESNNMKDFCFYQINEYNKFKS